MYQAKSEQGRALVDYNTAIQLDEDHPDSYLHRGQVMKAPEGECRAPEEVFGGTITQLDNLLG